MEIKGTVVALRRQQVIEQGVRCMVTLVRGYWFALTVRRSTCSHSTMLQARLVLEIDGWMEGKMEGKREHTVDELIS